MSGRLRLLPDGLAGRFALLLICALIAANLVALVLLGFERGRLDRAAKREREIERVVSLVPAIEAAQPQRRGAIAREASTRFSRLSVDPQPLVAEAPESRRSRLLRRELGEALVGREVRAAILRAGHGGHHGRQGQREVIVVSIRLSAPDAGPQQWLNARSRGGRAPPRGLPGRMFLTILALSLVTVLLVGLLFLRRLTRPLAALERAARAAGRGDRDARVPETGAREMRQAAAAFNDMQERIARFEAERMRTLAAVGHDLRTPITSLRIRAEMLAEDEGAPMIRTLDDMTVMAEGLIAYARGARDSEPVSRLALGSLLARLCEERGAVLSVSQEVEIDGRPVALRRAFGNLIDNALRYGGGAALRLERRGREAVVIVEDAGPGIALERLETIFEPFVRGEESRSAETGGAGLGLAIARNILTAHGGGIALENRAEGGLRAVVRLPLAARS
ncbi:ATP-binding protein [Sulfitobacter aestuarii]|uniref:histidine kinase n=1 Tax=Sulfitobacter aestuarii TaxID=2161676 RepID=A0ABW5U3S5_9RHOB